MLTIFLEVLEEWGSIWMWLSFHLIGNNHWLEEAIEAEPCVAMTDGLYIREVFPNVYSAAFILECSKFRGRIVGSFPKQSTMANTYQGELIGLKAIHLILLAAGRVQPGMTGTMEVASDCLGAFGKNVNSAS